MHTIRVLICTVHPKGCGKKTLSYESQAVSYTCNNILS